MKNTGEDLEKTCEHIVNEIKDKEIEENVFPETVEEKHTDKVEPINFIKEIANMGSIGPKDTLDQEVDLEVTCHIEKTKDSCEDFYPDKAKEDLSKISFIKLPLNPVIVLFETEKIDKTLKCALPIFGKVLDSRTIKILDVEYGFRIIGNDLDYMMFNNGSDIIINTYDYVNNDYSSVNYCASIDNNSIVITPEFKDDICIDYNSALMSKYKTYGIYIYKK